MLVHGGRGKTGYVDSITYVTHEGGEFERYGDVPVLRTSGRIWEICDPDLTIGAIDCRPSGPSSLKSNHSLTSHAHPEPWAWHPV
jgi:hypothetical protein